MHPFAAICSEHMRGRICRHMRGLTGGYICRQEQTKTDRALNDIKYRDIMDRKVLLMILDGWGEGKHDWTNAIYTQGAPYIDSLREKYPFGHLQACG